MPNMINVGIQRLFGKKQVSENLVAKKDSKAQNTSVMDQLKPTQNEEERVFEGSLSLDDLSHVEDTVKKVTLAEVKTLQDSAMQAKRKFNNEPSGTQKERELQKKYIDAENEYAQNVLDCQESTEKDLYDAIHELRIIVDFAKHPSVQDKVAVTKQLMESLNKKLDEKNAPKWQKLAQDNGIEIDTDLAKQIAEASQKSVGYQRSSTSLCAMRVRQALESVGAVEANETKVSSAYMLKDKYLQTGSFAKIEVDTLEGLKDLPPGCIIVWERGPGFCKAFAQHGHVAVTQGAGKATSDYNQEIKNYKTNFTVYVPKKVSANERVQNAKISTEAFAKQPYVPVTANSSISHKQYLFDYVKAAHAVLKDGGVPKSEVQDLINLMKNVPKKSINSQEQKVLSEIFALIPRLEYYTRT